LFFLILTLSYSLSVFSVMFPLIFLSVFLYPSLSQTFRSIFLASHRPHKKSFQFSPTARINSQLVEGSGSTASWSKVPDQQPVGRRFFPSQLWCRRNFGERPPRTFRLHTEAKNRLP
jgi:hypothetical protein